MIVNFLLVFCMI